jgi:EmrB/QacA subfamily drug resistance transporter
MAGHHRIIPVVVACPLFLQNLDTTVMATALPVIATSLDAQVLHLNLAITSYLLSLAVFLPLSGWLADRYGARAVFCWAIGLFSAGSALCGAATSLWALVAFRLLQGMGGALMVPVARLILLRSVPPALMVSAMIWFTVPPTIGRMVGPLLGGAIVTWTSWRWIFLLNIPFGVLGILAALHFVDDRPEDRRRTPVDTRGFLLLAAGLTVFLAGMETVGKQLVPAWATVLGIGAGAALLLAYVRYSRAREAPVVDLGVLRWQTFRASVVGGIPLRIAIGASPFLLPLMLQVGFGLSPLHSGLLTFASALGSLATRAVMGEAIRRIGFRSLLIGATVATSLFYVSYAFFRPQTPHLLVFLTLLGGGLVNSLVMVSLTTLGFAEIPKPRMSHATTLSTMAQQVSLSVGVVAGALAVSFTAWWRDGDPTSLAAADFYPAFVAIGLSTLASLFSFVRLAPDVGSEMRPERRR